MENMTPALIAETIVKALDSKKAENVKLLKTTALTVMADYFVICTANSTTQIKSLTDEVEKVLTEAGEPPLRREGYRAGGWVLLDFGCAIVHVFLKETRDFYNLERLWNDAEEIDLSSLLAPC
ncbi:MAG: ribosome silencing factor [Oscillospiraceae bacterium]